MDLAHPGGIHRGEYGTMTANQPPDTLQVFRSPTAAVAWVVWLLFAVGNWIDLAVQGRDHASAVAAATLLLATGVAYVTAQRPRIIADKSGMTVRNPLRDHRIGWPGVDKVDLADLLRVHVRWGSPADAAPGAKEQHKVISAWAVHYSRRRQLATEARARRAARSPGLRRSSLGLPSGGRGLRYGGGVSGPETSSPEAEAEKIVRLLSERATAAKAEAVWASGTAEPAGSEAAERTAAIGTPTGTGTAPATGTAAGTGTAPATGTAAGTGTAPATGTAAGTGAAAATKAAPGTGAEAASGTQAASPAGGITALDAVGWPGESEPLKSTWSGRAIAALVIPALILLLVWLL